MEISADSVLLQSHSNPHVAELAAVKSSYVGKVIEMDKRQEKLAESQTSVAKVLIPSCPVLAMSSFRVQVGIYSVYAFSFLFQ